MLFRFGPMEVMSAGGMRVKSFSYCCAPQTLELFPLAPNCLLLLLPFPLPFRSHCSVSEDFSTSSSAVSSISSQMSTLTNPYQDKRENWKGVSLQAWFTAAYLQLSLKSKPSSDSNLTVNSKGVGYGFSGYYWNLRSQKTAPSGELPASLRPSIRRPNPLAPQGLFPNSKWVTLESHQVLMPRPSHLWTRDLKSET